MAAVPGVNASLFTIDKQEARRKRRYVGKAISKRSMRLFEPTMTRQIDVFLRIILASAQSPIDMSTTVKHLTMDIVSLLAFGYPLNTQIDEENRFLVQAHAAECLRCNVFVQWPLLHTLKVNSILKVLARADVRRFWAILEKMIASRMAEDKHIRHDFYSCVVDELSPNGEYLQDSEIWTEADFFFPAGSDTIAACLSAAFFYLSRNPVAYTKLTQEIRSAFQKGDEIKNGTTLSNCQYLRACIDETLRISPAVPGTPWRESNEPFIVDGHVIPPGVQVGVNIYTLHHNEEYFPEPVAFKPERWIEGPTTKLHDAFLAFSAGERTCLGRDMAYLETSIVLAKTLWYFDFEVAPGTQGKLGEGGPGLGSGRERRSEFQLYDIITSDTKGPNLVFRPRGMLWKELSAE
ncbi:hypothetical protein DL765_009717 [Monosporascus sp. GIB2]|nr:hypothetical protein DL765_009717 [Monosporascus sp. GIB2]